MQLSGIQLASLTLIGLLVGILGGMLGLGGGVLVIPTLVTLYGFTYPQAVGTSLGMLLPPIGIFAFLTFYRTGNVSIAAAGLLALGFALGAFLGAKLVTTGSIPQDTLRVLFAYFLMYVAGSVLFRDEPRVRGVLYSLIIVGAFGAARLALQLIGKRWEKRYGIEPTYRARLRVPLAPDYEI